MPIVTSEQSDLFISLFRGRQDVYARYWEKGDHAGYSPAYEFDWTEFRAFKNKGGTLKDFPNKRLMPLTPEVARKHLLGQQTVGIYPILQDNTSYFIAADFDGDNWLEDAKSFINECRNYGLETYLERSRSGRGGHVWIFFENSYPCYKSRQIALEFIRGAFKRSEFDKEVSFDRLFPNQDSVPKNGFGNLIALPLQGKVVMHNNTVFIDPETGASYPDQWGFLKNIKRHSHTELDAVYNNLFNNPANKITSTAHKCLLSITLNNKLALDKSQLTPQIIDFLKERLNFISTEYLTKKRLGKSAYKVEKYFKLIEEQRDRVFLPRGFLNQLKIFLDQNQTAYRLTDERPNLEPVQFFSNIKLFPEQSRVVEQAIQNDCGVIVAPSGSGKTIIGLSLVAQRTLPALILVHRKQLLDQWMDRIESFLGIPKIHIGQYSGTKKRQGKEIAVAMLQSLARLLDLGELKDKFGTIIVDECHHIPAKTFRQVVSELNPRYLYGLTATPKRKHNDEPLIYAYIGDIVAGIKTPPASSCPTQDTPAITEICIRETSLAVPFKFSTDNFQLLSKIICFDTVRNQLIIKDIQEQVAQGKKVLLLSERRDHLEILNLYLKGLCETIVVSGEDSETKRQIKLKQIENGHFHIVLSTGQFFGEGLDIHAINCLILAFPFSFEGKLIQYIGRLRGHNNHKVIIDYRDNQIPFLERQFKQGQRVYKKVLKISKL